MLDGFCLMFSCGASVPVRFAGCLRLSEGARTQHCMLSKSLTLWMRHIRSAVEGRSGPSAPSKRRGANHVGVVASVGDEGLP